MEILIDGGFIYRGLSSDVRDEISPFPGLKTHPEIKFLGANPVRYQNRGKFRQRPTQGFSIEKDGVNKVDGS